MSTSGQASPSHVAQAQAAAQRLGLPYLPRRKKEALSHLLGTRASALLLFGGTGVTLTDLKGTFTFHPGMAHLRMMRLAAGEPDTLVRLAELQPGESFLDCTLGLAQDALVAARAVGPSGKVVGLEVSVALHAVVSEGLLEMSWPEASARIEVHRADTRSFLPTLPSGSFDVVLFDPMFEEPKKAQPSFEMLRRYADHAPLTLDTLREARRVARRSVLIKGARHSQDLAKLGLKPEPGSRFSDVVWAKVPAA